MTRCGGSVFNRGRNAWSGEPANRRTCRGEKKKAALGVTHGLHRPRPPTRPQGRVKNIGGRRSRFLTAAHLTSPVKEKIQGAVALIRRRLEPKTTAHTHTAIPRRIDAGYQFLYCYNTGSGLRPSARRGDAELRGSARVENQVNDPMIPRRRPLG